MRKALIIIGLVGLGLVAIVAIGLTVYTADIRPEEIRGSLSVEREAEGRRWLQRSVEAHGGAEALARLRDARVEGELAFVTFMGRAMVNVFPDDVQRYELDLLLGTDDMRLKLVGGERDGEVWGVQQWAVYRTLPGGEPTFFPVDAPDANIKFWPPTMAYFLFMPWRIVEAPVVQYVGDRTVDGVDYAVVFATWGGLEVDPTVDQYLQYIDKQTGLTRWTYFTVRDSGGFMAGGVELLEHRAVDGLMLPHRTRTVAEPGDPETMSHEIRVARYVLGPGRPDSHYVPRPDLKGRK